ncbi:hypothetical protein ABTY61_12320 [Kitasatospora sp. NPDC096128]|uniref:hypothetical protein n=1 Tax=Kitasatospora sp. NPDC096128 TaxID=3155547 RepID=UPI003330E453
MAACREELTLDAAAVERASVAEDGTRVLGFAVPAPYRGVNSRCWKWNWRPEARPTVQPLAVGRTQGGLSARAAARGA